MRLGFFLGFLIGGGLASLLSRSTEEVEHAVGEAKETAANVPGAAKAEARELKGKIQLYVQDARDAAREARLEKEAEMLHLYDEMVHRPTPPSA